MYKRLVFLALVQIVGVCSQLHVDGAEAPPETTRRRNTDGGDGTAGGAEAPLTTTASDTVAAATKQFNFYVGLNNIYENNQLLNGLDYSHSVSGSDETGATGIWTIDETYGICENATLEINVINIYLSFNIYVNDDQIDRCIQGIGITSGDNLTYSECGKYDISSYIDGLRDKKINVTVEIGSYMVEYFPCDYVYEQACTPFSLFDKYEFFSKATIKCQASNTAVTTVSPFESDSMQRAKFLIRPDVFFDELSWRLVNESNVTIWNETSNDYGGTNEIRSNAWIEDGCYTFRIDDSGNNGLIYSISEYGGWFTFSVNDKIITFGNQTFNGSSFELYFCTNNTIVNDNVNHNMTLLISGCDDIASDFDITISHVSTNMIYYKNHYMGNSDYGSEYTETLQLFMENNCYQVVLERSLLCFYQIIMDNNESWECVGTNRNDETLSEQSTSLIVCGNNNNGEYETSCSEQDYNINFPQKGYYSGLAGSYGCADAPCLISKKFVLNDECMNASLGVKMVHTGEAYSVYINSDLTFSCNSSLSEVSSGDIFDCRKDNSTLTSINLASIIGSSESFVISFALTELSNGATNYGGVLYPYNDEYDLFGGVIISCDETNGNNNSIYNNNSCSNVVSMTFTYDDNPLDIEWQVTNSSNDIIFWDSLGGFHSANKMIVSESNEMGYCLFDGDNECFTLTITDSNEDGIWPNGYFEMSVIDYKNKFQVTNITLTLDVQTFETDGGYIEFCIDEIKNGENNLTIELNYDTAIAIVNVENGVTIYDNSFNIYKTKVDDDKYTKGESIGWTIWVNDGCYEVTVYDVGDEEKDLIHGFYQIWMNNELVSLGGYYQRYETSTICTDKRHMSYCMYNSGNCVNNTAFVAKTEYISSTDDEYLAKSVSSLTNSVLTEEGSKDTLAADSLSCLASISCNKMNDLFLDTYSYAAFGLAASSVGGSVVMRDNYTVWIPLYSGLDAYENTNFECLGTQSCVLPTAGKIIGYSTASIVNGYGMSVILSGSMVIMNTNISLIANYEQYWVTDYIVSDFGTYYLTVEAGYYALFNASLMCSEPAKDMYYSSFQIGKGCYITCDSEAPQYIPHMSEYCSDDCVIDDICNFIYNERDIEDVSLMIITQLNYFIENVKENYLNECGIIQSNENSLLFDIGYPLYSETDILNNELDEPICCLAYESCKLALSINTNLGNIYCLGSESCSESSLLWTGNNDEHESDEENQNIYCMGSYSCAESLIQAGNNIICSSQGSCENGFILEATSLYCTMSACAGLLIRKVSNIYIIDVQSDVVIYSGYIGEMHVYFRGSKAGYGVTIYCNDGDVCNIDCGYKSCDPEYTTLYCYGKCSVKCHASWDGSLYSVNGIDCVNFVTSLSPSAAPSAVPTGAPTVAPSNAPTQLPSAVPTNAPSMVPSNAPSFSPTVAPTDVPTQVPTDIPSMTPSAAPTMFPTFMPTDYQLLTEEELSSYFNWVIGILILIVILMLLIGCFDAKRKHNESQFEWMAIIGFAIYAIDFFSDIFFCGKLYTLWIDERLEYTFYYFILFLTSIVFLVVPMISNIGQLHKEVSKWTKDPILVNTEIPLWIASYMKFVYILALLCGSSFSAISLCNSQFLEWPIFSMNLSKYHRKLFQTKRFFSIVLFENIPQLMIQCATLYLVIDENNEGVTLLITIFSMIFTIFSILSCILEYYTTSTIIKSRNLVLIDMHVDSQAVGQFKGYQFRNNVLHKRRDIIHLMKRIISVTARQVDLLKPQQDANGVSLTFIIQIDEIQFEKIKTKFHNAIANNGFDKEFSNIFGLVNGRIALASTLSASVPASDVKISMFTMNNEANNNKCLQLCHRIRFGFGKHSNDMNKVRSIEMSNGDLCAKGAILKSVYSEMSLGSPKSMSQSDVLTTPDQDTGVTWDGTRDTGDARDARDTRDVKDMNARANIGTAKIEIDKNASELANDNAFAKIASRTATPKAYESESESDEIPTAIPNKPSVETTVEWIEQRLNRDIEFSEGMASNEIEMFLNEWKEKNVTFQDLLDMKKDIKKFNQFKNGFDNQSFDIWYSIKYEISKFKQTDAINAIYIE